MNFTKEQILELLRPIKVVKVLAINKHPNADRLVLVDVQMVPESPTSQVSETKQVVTGATNMRPGDLVPFLGEGNVVPGFLILKGEKVTLAKKDLRGIISDSMILAEDEIGLSEDHGGILILNEVNLTPTLSIHGEGEIIGKSFVEVVSEEILEKIYKNTQQSVVAEVTTKNVDTTWQKYLNIPQFKSPSMDVIVDEKKIDEVLTKGVKEIFPGKEELKKLMMSGKRLRLYTGIDPTANFLHVGHFIWMKKLAEFQKLGHQIVFLIGAFTAMIGDPDKKYTRQPLTKDQVFDNFKSYESTAAKLLNFNWEANPITILNNYDWLSKVTLEDWLQIMSKVTMQHILSHDMFKKRIEENAPIRLHEVSYPLMQGFDCVAMNIDLEVGGSDQTFNMLTGRLLSKEILGKEKIVMTLKLLTDPTGAKMGKTTGNAIASTDAPADMFGKIMSWPDTTIPIGFELLTDLSVAEVAEIEEKLKVESPMVYKKKLAFDIVKMLKTQQDAKNAQEYFERTVQNKENPEDITELNFVGEKNVKDLLKFLVEKNIIVSNSEARRLLESKGIEFNGAKLTSVDDVINFTGEDIVKVGKRNWVKLLS